MINRFYLNIVGFQGSSGRQRTETGIHLASTFVRHKENIFGDPYVE